MAMAASFFRAIGLRMADEVDELRRVKARIADLERCIAHEKGAVDGSPIGSRDRAELLQMLVRTLASMKAREATLSRVDETSRSAERAQG